ncbi:MAG: flagellar assembly peptidoglycan hydrolase FlgJ [Pseudorhodoplanes sp.]
MKNASFVPLSSAFNKGQMQAAAALYGRTGDKTDAKNALQAKARGAAEDFEAVFLNTMFSQMFTAMDGEGPFGGGKSIGVWRSLLTDEYSKSFARTGGIGIADHVYASLLAQQEARN